MQRTTIAFLFLLLFPLYHYGQNCSANPGGDQAICIGDELTLLGEDSPLYLEPLDATWTLVASSPVATVEFDDEHALVTGVSQPGGGTLDSGTYEFQLCVICVDHDTACQSVNVIVGEIENSPEIDPHDDVVCGSNLVITGSEADPGVTTTWFIDPEFKGTYTIDDHILTLNHNGRPSCEYTITYIQSIGSCVEKAVTTVSFIQEYPNITANVNEPNSCPSCSNRIRICGTLPGCGGKASWEVTGAPTGINPDDISFDTPNSHCTWVKLPANGEYCFDYTIDNGVCLSDTATVCCVIDEQPGFGLSANENFTYCQDVWDIQSLFLEEPFFAGATYNWFVQYSSIVDHGITFSNTNTNSTTATFNNAPMTIGPDGWFFRIQVDMEYLNCTDTKFYSFYVNPGLEVKSKDVMLLCGGDPYYKPSSNVTATGGGGSLQATVLESPSASVPVGSTTSAYSTLNLTEEGTYCFEITSSRTATDPSSGVSVTCTDRDTFCVIVADVPTIDCGSPITTCLLTTQLNGNTPTNSMGDPLNIPVYWEQIGGPTVTILNANTEDPTITGMEYGNTYTFRYVISDEPDCEILCENTVTVLPKEECSACELMVDVGPCVDGCFQVTLFGAETYMWQPAADVDDTDPNNPIICTSEGGVYQVFGFIDNEICGSAVVQVEAGCEPEEEMECEFSIRKRCGFCSCGTPVGGARIYDSEGNWLNTNYTDVDVEWSVDGGPFTPGSGSWAQYYLTGSYVLCANVSFTQNDGMLCDTTMCVEVACHGDCPTVSFATCADAPFSSYPECENYNAEWACENGGFYGWVWAIDAAGNPLDDFNVDWDNDGIFSQNPTFMNTWQIGTCDNIPVRIANWAGTCDTTVYFDPGCCSGTSPEIHCGERGEGGFEIFFDPICGAESYTFTVICIDNGWVETITITAEEAKTGSFVVPLMEGCNWFDISMTSTCSDGTESDPSNCIFMDMRDGYCWESNEPCWDLWGDGRSNAGSDSDSDNVRINGDLIFPNPASNGLFYLQLDPDNYKNAGTLQINIQDITGKLVYTTDNDPGIYKREIRTSLPDGMYLVSIYDQAGKLMNSERLIIGNGISIKESK